MSIEEQKKDLQDITKLLIARMESNPEEFDEDALLSRWGPIQRQFEACAPVGDLTAYFEAKNTMVMKKLFGQMVKELTVMASGENASTGAKLKFGVGIRNGGSGTATLSANTAVINTDTATVSAEKRFRRYQDLIQSNYDAIANAKGVKI